MPDKCPGGWARLELIKPLSKSIDLAPVCELESVQFNFPCVFKIKDKKQILGLHPGSEFFANNRQECIDRRGDEAVIMPNHRFNTDNNGPVAPTERAKQVEIFAA